MSLIKYTDSDGKCWSVLVPDGVLDHSLGAWLGPPDLSSLDLDEDLLNQLQCLLVENNLYNAEQLHGNRAVLYKIIKALNLSTSLIRAITSLYQADYYGEMDH